MTPARTIGIRLALGSALAYLLFSSCQSGGSSSSASLPSHRIVLPDQELSVSVPVRYELLSVSYQFGIHRMLIGDRSTIGNPKFARDEWQVSVYDVDVGGPFGLGSASADATLSEVKALHELAHTKIVDVSRRDIDGSSNGIVVVTESPVAADRPWIGHEAYSKLADSRSIAIESQIDAAVVSLDEQRSIFELILSSLSHEIT